MATTENMPAPSQPQLPDQPEPQADGHHIEEGFDPAPHRPSSKRLFFTAFGGIALLAILVVVGVVPRVRALQTEHEDAARDNSELASVVVEKPALSKLADHIDLPGTVQAVQDTLIYARTNGYVHKYTVDIGDHVKEGQVLATIDTPEVDQELRQAEASANQSRANILQTQTALALAKTENERYQTLVKTGVVSQQDTEEHAAKLDSEGANVQASQASLGSAEANVKRLQELKQFATVVAPFDGVITSRTIEVGQLVAAGTGAGQAMFRLSKMDVVRVYVNVPQLEATAIKVGDDATVTLREIQGRSFVGKVTRTSNELDLSTRTLLTEVRIPNDDGTLLAGMYASVKLKLNIAVSPLTIRATSLVTNAAGTRVAVVDNGVLHWRQVVIQSDMGDRLAIASGITENDQVVTVPSDRLREGLAVKPELAKSP
jgi:RND family efflux transporter MFP subunit